MHVRNKVAVVSNRVLSGEPIAEVKWFEPENEKDSGFIVIAAGDTPDNVDDYRSICIHCLLDDYPEAGKLMQWAKP
jgi:hypothetical protein